MARETYTHDELIEQYPDLAHAVGDIVFSNKKKYLSFWIQYSGKYLNKKGERRRVALSKVIRILEENGYEITIDVIKKKTDI
jgi:hypothetical protein